MNPAFWLYLAAGMSFLQLLRQKFSLIKKYIKKCVVRLMTPIKGFFATQINLGICQKQDKVNYVPILLKCVALCLILAHHILPQ